jgi:hypothetical protein
MELFFTNNKTPKQLSDLKISKSDQDEMCSQKNLINDESSETHFDSDMFKPSHLCISSTGQTFIYDKTMDSTIEATPENKKKLNFNEFDEKLICATSKLFDVIPIEKQHLFCLLFGREILCSSSCHKDILHKQATEYQYLHTTIYCPIIPDVEPSEKQYEYCLMFGNKILYQSTDVNKILCEKERIFRENHVQTTMYKRILL